MKTQNTQLLIVMTMMLCLPVSADWKSNLRTGLLGTASIHVVDEGGNPLEGVRVSMHFGIMNGKGYTFDETTDKRGMVQFTGKSNDKCQVIASKRGYFSSWCELIFFPPHDENFSAELERLAKTGRWESSPKNCTLVLQREYTSAEVREQCLEVHCSHICPTNVPLYVLSLGDDYEYPQNEVVLSIKEVTADNIADPMETSYVISIESSSGHPCFVSRARRKNSDYRFDTVAPESGYMSSIPLYSVRTKANRVTSIYDVNKSYIVYRRKAEDGGNSYVVVHFIDMTMRKSGEFKLSFSYVCIPEEAENVIQFKISGKESPRTVNISDSYDHPVNL